MPNCQQHVQLSSFMFCYHSFVVVVVVVVVVFALVVDKTNIS